MGKKYIVEIGRLERLYKAHINGNGMPNITWLSPEVDLTPYTEPDTEKVREEAYKDGREVGIKDGMCEAWEAARKICTNWVLSDSVLSKIFGMDKTIDDVMKENTASEAIAKIRQYEQKQEKKDGVWIASEANEPSVDITLICSKCGYAITIKPHETPALNFCPKCGDCKKPKEEES